MSSQIIAYGFVELAPGSEAANLARLAEARRLHPDPARSMAARLESPRSGWPSPTLAFAASYKATGEPDEVAALQAEFEALLRRLTARSAHLSIAHEGGAGRHLDYAYGPTSHGVESVWMRVGYACTPGVAEPL